MTKKRTTPKPVEVKELKPLPVQTDKTEQTDKTDETLSLSKGKTDRQTPITYLIAQTPFNGANYLFDLLTLNGLGLPNETNFFIGYGEGVKEVYPTKVHEVIEANRDKRGIAGLMTNLTYLDHLDEQLYPAATPDIIGLFTHHIRIQRTTKVLQAVDWMLAQQTGIYSLDDLMRIGTSAPEPHYDRAQIVNNLIALQALEGRWSTLYTDLMIKPLIVLYEDLHQQPEKVLDAVCDYFGVPLPSKPQTVELTFLMDARAQGFADRYEAGE